MCHSFLLQHRLQRLHPRHDFFLQLRQIGENFLGGPVFYRFVQHFLVAVEGEVVSLDSDFGLGHAKALGAARAFPFAAGSLYPALQHIRQVVSGVFVDAQGGLWGRAEFGFVQQGLAFVVQAPAVGLHVVEPDLIGAAGVGFGEEQNRRRDSGIGFEAAGGGAK